jgi:ATP-dependent helicase/nuclease subunit A
MSISNALPADASIREQALDPRRSFIVEAPAGSGKTELLTRRYLRLLATVTAPEEILAITFTRKAAAEMRSRVQQALTMAQQATPPDDAKKVPVWQLAKAVLVQDSLNEWQLLAYPGRLRIMTIDAFNLMLSRQLPLISGAGAALPIAKDTRQLYADVALRLVERLGRDDEAASEIEQLLRHLDNRYEQFESLLAQELARREHWLELGLMRLDMSGLRERLQATLCAVVNDELNQLRRAIPADVIEDLVRLAAHAAGVLRASAQDSPIATCTEMRSLPEGNAESLPQWQGIAELLLTQKGEWRAKVDKNIGILPAHKVEKQRLKDLLERLQREPGLESMLHLTRELPPTRYSDEQWHILSALLMVLKLAIAELEVVMRERNAADYPANAIAARRALGTVTDPTDLALRLDYRHKHLLIDEFQDTSRGQVELLALLTAGWSDGDGRTLFCVGDPMQSIYRFRHADVGLFLNLKRHGLNQLRLTPLRLSVNFRCTQPVLHWVNETFASVFPRYDDPSRGAVSYTLSESSKDADKVGLVQVHAVLSEPHNARIVEAQQVVNLIAQRKTSQLDSHIAVLVSNRSHLQQIIRELRARNIAFQAVEIDALAKRPAILDLIALTRALVHLADRTAWLSVLRAPWCGLSLRDLYTLFGGDTETSITVLHALQVVDAEVLSQDAQVRVARCLPIFEKALARRGRIGLRDCVESAWLALGGAATLSDVSALADCEMYFARLEQLERNGDLEDVTQLESQLLDLFAAGDAVEGAEDGSPTKGRIELMTIHRAKGLEFDIVIVPALDAGVRREDSPLLRAQELPHIGEDALLLAPIAASGSESDPIYDWLDRLDKDRGRFERSRLLYVAATRAERELHLFGAVKTKDGALVKPTSNTFLHLLWPVVKADFEVQSAAGHASTAIDSATSNQYDADRTIEKKIITKRLPLYWQTPRPESPGTSAAVQSVIEDQPLHPEFEWASETARHVGTVVHREIERIARVGLSQYTQMVLLERTQLFQSSLAELGVPQLLRPAAAQRVLAALQTMLNDDRGRWLLAGKEVHQEADSELAISGMIDNDVVNGIIDRTFVDRDGIRWVVDFKTSTHEGGGLEQFLDSEVDRYRLQLTRYIRLMQAYRPGQSIRAALYFPLLSAWREVNY